MAKQYLDKDGLTHFWGKIKSLFAPKNRGVEYIRGTWTAASGTWTGVSEDTELYDGKQIVLYMPFNGSGNATLNLTLSDGSTTGAKNVYFESTTRFTTHKGQNAQLPLIYHKAQKLSNGNTYEGWWYVANRDTTNVGALYLTYTSFKAKTALYRYQFLLSYDEQYLLPINAVDNSIATTKTLTTLEFDAFGQIYYWQSTTNINANNVIGNWAMYSHYTLADVRYSFNTGSTLTANKSVYLVCVPQVNGKAKLHTTPITQTLPTTEDGLLYKYLGQAYDTYRITMNQNKPCYVYKNGGIQEYVRDAITVNGHTVNADVPSNAVFTDTTYSSKAAVQNGTDVSLVTTGEKYTWNTAASGANTTYSLSKSGSTITLTGSDGSTSSVEDSDTTYTVPTKTSQLTNDSGFVASTSSSKLFKKTSYSHAYSITGGGTATLTGTNFGISTPSGYTPIAVLNARSGHTQVAITGINGGRTGSDAVMTLRNIASSAQSPTAVIEILYVKSGLL